MNWGQVHQAMVEGKKVTRKGWNGKGMWAVYVRPEAWQLCYMEVESLKDREYYYGLTDYQRGWYALKDAQGKIGPWVPSTSDLMADDWEVVE